MHVAVLPVGAVAAGELAAAEAAAAAALGLPVRRLAPAPPPPAARDPRRGQWDATAVLRAALALRPPGAARLLAVTDLDLALPVLSFVFGQAQLDGPGALVSLARLRPQWHGRAPDAALLAARLRKETMHELGHTCGLVHCPDPGCAMALAVNVAGIDGKTEAYCAACGARVAAVSSGLVRAAGPAEV